MANQISRRALSDSDGVSDYDPDLWLQQSERQALYARVVCASVLVAAAIVALLMVIGKSWRKRDGRRNKSRLFAFLVYLISLVISRLIFIVDEVLTIRGPNDIGTTAEYYQVINYYSSLAWQIRTVVNNFFGWLSDILFLGLVLVEVTRHNARVGRPRYTFEAANFSLIFALSAIAVTLWVSAIMFVVDSQLAYFTWNGRVLVGLSIAYAAIEVLFATIILFGKKSPSTFNDSTLKSRYTLLHCVIYTLWISEALYLASLVYTYYGDYIVTTTISALSVVIDVLTIILVLGMAFLAWKSDQLCHPALNDHAHHDHYPLSYHPTTNSQTHHSTNPQGHYSTNNSAIPVSQQGSIFMAK